MFIGTDFTVLSDTLHNLGKEKFAMFRKHKNYIRNKKIRAPRAVLPKQST